jgi:hypothetical protein
MPKAKYVRPPSRAGKVAINVYVTELERMALKVYAAKNSTTLDALMTEAVELATKVPFSSYISKVNAERLRQLAEASGKTNVRLLTEALDLLFKAYE